MCKQLYSPQEGFLHLFLQKEKNTNDRKNKLYMMSIFPCTILVKEQECYAPFYDSRHPLQVFVQEVLPLGEMVCEAKAKEAECLRAVIA